MKISIQLLKLVFIPIMAIYGTGSSASVSVSQSKAKLNYAQVEEQSGLYVGEGGLALQVGNHTHLKGGLIKSQAEASKNQFNTKSFSTEDIQNHSEVKSQSMSAGFSTGNMMQNAMSALGTVASALGNKNESNQSTTKSAVSDNIHINASSEDSQTQQHLNTLSRDVEKANQKVEKYNLSEIQEQQEMAKVIGDIANNSILLTLKPKLDEAEKQKAEANAILANKNSSESQRNQAQQQLEQATQTLNQYGQSSDIQLAVRAVTGLLQGLATKNTGAAVVGALSPYANLAIKNATTDPNTKEVNITANLMAHALLGAIEAKATGNNALAGAVGAITGEVAAKVITEKLYNKPVEELTESEKQTVSALSQLAGGLAGGLVGDSSASGLSSSEIAKRAVENNFLSQREWNELDILSKKKVLTYEEALRVLSLMKKDKDSDVLLKKYQAQFNNGEKLTELESAQLLKWVSQYGNTAEQMQLLSTPVDSPQLRPDYSELRLKAQKTTNFANSYEAKQAQSLNEGLALAAGLGVNSAVVRVGEKLGSVVLNSTGNTLMNTLTKYPITTEIAATAVVNTGYQLSQDRPYNPYDLLQAEFSTILTRNKSLGQQTSINVMLSTLNTENPNDYGWNALGAISGSITSGGISKINIGNKYGNLIFRPVFASAIGEYSGDKDVIKGTFEKYKNKLNELDVGNDK